MEKIDITIIGAGVIGLALAERFAESSRDVLVLEKNSSFGQETSSRNSEVIHAGIYYPKDSLKARLCVRGKELLYDFLRVHQIRHKKVGKFVIAAERSELAALRTLFDQARTNGLTDLEWVEPDELSRRLAKIHGVGAFFSPSTGIFDTHEYMKTLSRLACKKGALILYESEFLRCVPRGDQYRIEVREPDGSCSRIDSRIVINAAGLSSDVVAARMGILPERSGYSLHYCKGDYFRLRGAPASAIASLVYPVPPKESLGIHLSPDLGGGLRLGPDATYISRDEADYRVNSASKDTFLRAAQRLMPSLESDDIVPDCAGIRPKLQGPTDGFRDFIIAHEADKGLPGIFSLIGIESPGLTASLAIADEVQTMVNEYLK
jgi:L-2-hydroxyglutarate oxidase LhgO